MQRFSLKIVGASGQGIISIGEILAKAFLRSGSMVYGYREYMSLIRGGHGSYQIDVSDGSVRSSEERVDVLIALNHHGFKHNLGDLKEGGVLVHDMERWTFKSEQQQLLVERGIRVLALPTDAIVRKLRAKPILANVLFSAFVWSACGGDRDLLKELVGEKFKKKKDLLALNMQAIDEGYVEREKLAADLALSPPRAPRMKQPCLLCTGSQAMGLGLVHAGMRAFFSYPMTPASPLLTFVADLQNETGVLVKQAEDEITAAQMMSGAMFAGTRAATATSGGGFDLMTETLSMNGIAENPAVFVLAQRPGPGTGLPTWTAQGDLFLAVHAGHGELPRCVLAIGDAADAFTLMPSAFNIAEEFQTPVIVLTDKHIAEGIFTEESFDLSAAAIRRGALVTDPARLALLKATDRYDPSAESGVSPRWLPGVEAATYVGQTDEHGGDGTSEEGAENARRQTEKRLRKMEAMKAVLPEPEVWRSGSFELRASNEKEDNQPMDLLIIGWGSTKGAVLDVLESLSYISHLTSHHSLTYLHYSYLWPLKTDRLQRLAARAKKVVVVEGNAQGQLKKLIRMECGLHIADAILKFDGRPFFHEELLVKINSLLTPLPNPPPKGEGTLTSYVS